MSSGYAVEAAIPSSLVKKAKKPNFIQRWLLKSLKGAVQQEREREEEMYVNKAAGLAIGTRNSIDSDRGIRFQVYRATGGFVIETAMYDRQKDRHLNSLHIITDDQDLGEQIGKIITMEALKQ